MKSRTGTGRPKTGSKKTRTARPAKEAAPVKKGVKSPKATKAVNRPPANELPPMEDRAPMKPRSRAAARAVEEGGDRTKAPKRSPRFQPLPHGVHQGLPIVAIVGRPNIGKSTLFNRLAGAPLALVEDVEGVTRDRHVAAAFIRGREVLLVDTGGFDPMSSDPLKEGIAKHVLEAIAEADAVVCMFDASVGLHPVDSHAVSLLRKQNRKVVYAANKADSKAQIHDSHDLYRLGVDKIIPLSALHGVGISELEDAIFEHLPEMLEVELSAHKEIPRVAIVGRPNAGKSSLVNRVLGEERQLVSDIPGTTMDAIDSLIERDGHRFVFIDTAGIRRKRGIDTTLESLAVMKAIRSIERADVTVLLIDAKEGIAEQDARLVGLIAERGRGLIIGLNKSDLLTNEERKAAIERTQDVLNFAPWAEILPLSAKTGRAVPKLLDALNRVLKERRKRVSTSELNRFFEQVLDRHPPPVYKSKAVRLYYVTQAEIEPPRFIVVTNEPEAIHFSYQRYVMNALRKQFGFEGTPIRVMYRPRSRRER